MAGIRAMGSVHTPLWEAPSVPHKAGRLLGGESTDPDVAFSGRGLQKAEPRQQKLQTAKVIGGARTFALPLSSPQSLSWRASSQVTK